MSLTKHLWRPYHCFFLTTCNSGHYDLLYQPDPPTVNLTPVVNYQYGMTSNYTPWDQGLSFDVNPHLMSIPNLMTDSTFGGMAPPMSPMPSVSPAPTSPFRVSSSQDMYQSPMQSHAPVPSMPPVSSPPPAMPSAAPPPMTTLPSRSSSGPQIRLNPLVMKPNLSHSLPVTTPFKK